jgi:hypothetical protein
MPGRLRKKILQLSTGIPQGSKIYYTLQQFCGKAEYSTFANEIIVGVEDIRG